MAKWNLLIKTLPLAVAMVAIALIRDYLLQIKGVIEFSDISPLLPAVALIIGFMMAGVLADYKESEKLPAEIAATLETLGDTVQVVLALNKDIDLSDFEPSYRKLVFTVEDWFMRRIDVNQVYLALNNFQQVVSKMHSAAGAGYATRALGETHNLRRLITRVDVITRTSFLPVGYALLDLLVGTTLFLLMISNYKTPIAEYCLIGSLSLIYVYMIRLIRDIDSPFDYDTRGNTKGSAEVDPFPLQEYRQRFESKSNS